jgi:hypothetical protein
VIVVVLALPARKAIDHDDEDDNDKRRGSFLIVLVVVVVLAPSASKAIDHDHEDDNDKRWEFLIVLVIVVVLALPARKAIDHGHDDEGNPQFGRDASPCPPPGRSCKNRFTRPGKCVLKPYLITSVLLLPRPWIPSSSDTF